MVMDSRALSGRGGDLAIGNSNFSAGVVLYAEAWLLAVLL